MLFCLLSQTISSFIKFYFTLCCFPREQNNEITYYFILANKFQGTLFSFHYLYVYFFHISIKIREKMKELVITSRYVGIVIIKTVETTTDLKLKTGIVRI